MDYTRIYLPSDYYVTYIIPGILGRDKYIM